MDRVYTSKEQFVTDSLRRMILRGDLKPGEQLVQRQLADHLSVSLTPIRESLRRLQAEGLVTYDPHMGSSVMEVDPGALVENYRIRSVLEGLAVELAAERITDEKLSELQDINQQFAFASDSSAFFSLNLEFHFKIYEASGSTLLQSLVNQLWQAFPRGPYIIDSARSVEEHQNLIQALRERDSASASNIAANHILVSMQQFPDAAVEG